MKKILMILIIFSSLLFSQQKYYTFSELRGMQDSSGNTHLFYRLHYSLDSGSSHYTENSIYHLDLQNKIDTLFLFDGGGWISSSDIPEFSHIVDYEFWNNDPAKFIYSGIGGNIDPICFLKRYDEDSASLNTLGQIRNGNIEISKQNDSLIFSNLSGCILKSNDGGRSFDSIPSLNGKELISLSPFNDSILFIQESNQLLKSTNRGLNFSVVDTFATDYRYFLYDKDGIHIYRITYSFPENYLSVSNNKGDAYSWVNSYSSSGKIFISIDTSQSGTIYLANGSNIYYSSDYGANFSLFKRIYRSIVGLYVSAPFTVYVATKYDIYKIQSLAQTSDTLETIKHLRINPEVLSLYPLAIGNLWVYDKNVEMYKSVYKIKVVKDTIIGERKYYELKDVTSKQSQPVFVRIDSAYGKIYQYNSGDVILYDFSADEIGDTTLFNKENGYEAGWFLESISSFYKWGIGSDLYLYNYIIPTSGYRLNTFVKGVGLYKDEGGELLYSTSILRGFVKDGITYGDTTLVGIEYDLNKIPTEFSLFQNYPNPFNPTTAIKYELPKQSRVQLIIYNILGQKVDELVNTFQKAGRYEVKWNAENFASGIYYYRIEAGNFVQTKKLILLK